MPVATMPCQVAIEGLPALEPGKRHHAVPPDAANRSFHLAFVRCRRRSPQGSAKVADMQTVDLDDHPLLLLETFVDPARFQGTVYRAANWQAVGHSRGFRRGGAGYCELSTPKRVFLYPLARNVGQQLSGAALDPTLRKGAPKIMLSADHIRSLPDVFRDIDDPRTRKGRRHSLHSTLALATAATLCGARGYKAIWEWIDDLGQKALARFEVRRRNGVRKSPCQSTKGRGRYKTMTLQAHEFIRRFLMPAP